MESQTISPNDLREILRRTEAGRNPTEALLTQYGYTKRHPRTSDLIISQTASIQNKAQTPRIAHNRTVNQQVESGAYYIDADTKEITGNVIFKPTAQWESVWYHHTRRK